MTALAEISAKTGAICGHLVVSLSEASEKIDGVALGCASVERVFSSPNRAACVLSGDADMPETARGKWTQCHRLQNADENEHGSVYLALKYPRIHAETVIMNTFKAASGVTVHRRVQEHSNSDFHNRQPPANVN